MNEVTLNNLEALWPEYVKYCETLGIEPKFDHLQIWADEIGKVYA